ncbi:MAG: sigma-70 family RNA polymerase sigma factor [Bacteroidales bacterium]|nr:sigma-70 family RNA polymerase sigma factor [Bacteroidales bacterium]MCB9013152.1 sigma-70 family RNA polymerase sigma factor [Bacteroidales bacterium]
MNKYEIPELIDALKKEDNRVLLDIYRIHFPEARHYIMANSGNVFDAEDIFQDAMLLIYLKIKRNSLQINSGFGSYLGGIIRFLWLKELERKRKYFGKELQLEDSINDHSDLLEDYIRMEKRKLILEHFLELGSDCQKLIHLFVNETPVDRITSLMGFSTDQYTRNRRKVCKERLVRAIWENPRFKELKNEAFRQDTKVPRW